MSDKPSRNEDEYFVREEAERLKRLRAQDTAERAAAERKSHHMRCPKCGGPLLGEAFHGIQIDRCGECHGVWLDQGELEALLKHEDPGMLRKVMGDLWGSLKRERPRT